MRSQAFIVGVFLVVFVWPASSVGQSGQLVDMKGLAEQLPQLYSAGRYADAVPLARRVLQISEQLYGSQHPGHNQ